MSQSKPFVPPSASTAIVPSSRAATSALVHSAVSAGLAPGAADLLVANLDETVLLGCVGTPVADLDASDATLVSVVLDMSGSMSPHKKAVIDAYNAMLSALSASKAAASILVSTWAFADTVTLLRGFQPVGWQKPLDRAEYAPDGCTALYDALLACMTGVVAYGQELYDNGVPSRRIVFVLSDGDDNASRARSLDVRTAARALLAQEAYTLAYAGFGSSDLAALAADVGFPTVVTTGASESELRRIFRQVSASVIRVSQGTAAGASSFF
jgi:uncharacterized protein YegL